MNHQQYGHSMNQTHSYNQQHPTSPFSNGQSYLPQQPTPQQINNNMLQHSSVNPYSYQNATTSSDPSQQHYKSQQPFHPNGNTIHSSSFDYSSPPQTKSHIVVSGPNSQNLMSNNNPSYFPQQYNNYQQPPQSMHNYHQYGGSSSFQQQPATMNNVSSPYNMIPSQDMSFKQDNPKPTSQSPINYYNNNLNTHPTKPSQIQDMKSTFVPQKTDSAYSIPPNTSFTPTDARSKSKSPSKTPTNSTTESNDESASDEESVTSPNARKSKKSTRACEACRRHHRKCDGGSPCQTCSGKGIGCVYTERKKRGPKNEATKLLKKEIEVLKERLLIAERMKSEWEQKCKELAKMSNVSISYNDQSMPILNVQNCSTDQNLTDTTILQQSSFTQASSNDNNTMSNNPNQIFSVTFDTNMTDSNTFSNNLIPVFSTSHATEDMNSKKRKQIEDEYTDNLKKQKTGEMEHLDLTKLSTIPTDGQRFALSSMVTRFITIWDKYVHPFHSLLPVKWQSAMPDLLYDLIRTDGGNSENSFFMYSLLCNSARSLGDIMLSRDLHHKAMLLHPLHVNNPDPRVGFGLILLAYYSMSVGSLKKAVSYCKDALLISEVLDRPQLNLQMNAYLSIASISDDYEERRLNFKRLGQTKQICDVIMAVTGEVQNEITHGGNTNFKDMIAKMADLLRLKNMSSANVTLMHEVAVYGILILCLHKASYKDLALNYGRKLLEIAKDSNFKHCCIGTTSTAIAQAASMFLDFEGYPEFYECMSIMDELSMRYELAGLMKKNVEDRFVLLSNHLSCSGSSNSGSDSNSSPNMVQLL